MSSLNVLQMYLYTFSVYVWFMHMVFNTTVNNISVILWRSVLLLEETGVPGENHRPSASHWQTLSHNVVSITPRLSRVRTHNIVVIGTDCIGSYKSNYHMITTITTSVYIQWQIKRGIKLFASILGFWHV